MKKTWGSTWWLVSSLALLPACGGTVEAEPLEAVTANALEQEIGRGHGCPRQARVCRAYCQQKGHTSGSCSGYGGGDCQCRDTEPAPEP